MRKYVLKRGKKDGYRDCCCLDVNNIYGNNSTVESINRASAGGVQYIVVQVAPFYNKTYARTLAGRVFKEPAISKEDDDEHLYYEKEDANLSLSVYLSRYLIQYRNRNYDPYLNDSHLIQPDELLFPKRHR